MARPAICRPAGSTRVRAWTAFVEHGDERRGAGPAGDPDAAGPARSRRSRPTCPRRRSPTSPRPRRSGSDSPLQTAVENVETELRRTAEDGDLVIAVTDADTRILWTYGGRVMRRKAETVNFVAGRPLGRRVASAPTPSTWPTGSTAPSMVFSAEHYASIVHNWVCWAAPVHDPATGVQLGVIDLSTTWDRTHPIGLATARVMARLIETAMPRSAYAPGGAARRDREPGLVADACSAPPRHGSTAGGCCSTAARPRCSRCWPCTPRGSRWSSCTRCVYGDQAVTFSTLKAEVSHLR